MTKRGRGHRCAYCGRILESITSRSRLRATRDHVVPKSVVYGTPTVWCCRECNELKADMPAEAWSEFMAKFPDWWKKKDDATLQVMRDYRKHVLDRLPRSFETLAVRWRGGKT